MATLYQSLRNNTHVATASAAALQTELSSCLGGRVMQQCTNNNWTPVNDMANIMAALHNELTATNWTWDPNVTGYTDSCGDSLLDERVQRGECGYVAAALRVLLVTAAPYGFGVPTAQVAVMRYDGQTNVGFIANHPNNLFNTNQNLHNPVTGTMHNGVRFWADHAVVYYNNMNYANRYFDACYNLSYPQLADMALVDITMTVQIVNGHPRPDFQGVARGVNGAYLNGYFRTVPAGYSGPFANPLSAPVPVAPRQKTCNIL